MSSCTLTTDTYEVTLDTIYNVGFNTTRIVNTYVFSDDTDAILDEGKNIDQIILTGVQYNNYDSSMASLNGMMEAQEEVEVTGLSDYYLNTDYLINDLVFNAITGKPEVYEFVITLERLEDRLPYS